MENSFIFKDEATQAVDVVFSKFKELIGCRNAELVWTDKECSMANINNGLVLISFADMLVAVRQHISLVDIQYWQEYNKKISYVGLGKYTIPLEKWNDPDVKRLSEFDLELLTKVYSNMTAATSEYQQQYAEAFNKLI